MRPSPPPDLLSIADLGPDLAAIVRRASEWKAERRRRRTAVALAGRTLALVFEKSSTRTRVSFEVAMYELGGHAIFLSSRDLQLGRGETIADTGRVLSRYVDAIAYRAMRHDDERALAAGATVPVLNALDDREHPFQVVADLLTLYEAWGGRFGGRRLAFIGDGNNVCNSLALGAALVGLDFVAASPAGYASPPEVQQEAKRLAAASGARIEWTTSPEAAARGADALYTDVWVSMGDEAETDARMRAFDGYRIDAALLAQAAPHVRVLHDLPAHRGLEITDDVIDGPQSLVWEQAENRLHANKAVLEYFLAPRLASRGRAVPRRTGIVRRSAPHRRRRPRVR